MGTPLEISLLNYRASNQERQIGGKGLSHCQHSLIDLHPNDSIVEFLMVISDIKTFSIITA